VTSKILLYWLAAFRILAFFSSRPLLRGLRHLQPCRVTCTHMPADPCYTTPPMYHT